MKQTTYIVTAIEHDETNQNPTGQSRVEQPAASHNTNTAQDATAKPSPDFPTKKTTTIMPKEVFAALQRYCIDTETPKHRALYLFIIDGLHAKHAITDDDYQRFRDMASQLTTTYEKK